MERGTLAGRKGNTDGEEQTGSVKQNKTKKEIKLK